MPERLPRPFKLPVEKMIGSFMRRSFCHRLKINGIKAQVKAIDMVSEGSDRNKIDTAFRILPDGIQCNPS